MARCSIIIPVYNRASMTGQCLIRVFRNRPPGLKEVIVVDDASTDITPELLDSYGERIKVVTHRKNTGFASACNDGAAVAEGEYLIFLNNDTIPTAGWLEAMTDYADSHPSAAAVGSKLLFVNDTVQHAGVVIGLDRLPRHLYAGFPSDHPAVNKARRFKAVTAACMLIRREVFEEAGGFDEAYLNCYEDVDLCLRLHEMGHEVHYCPESVLYHFESVSEGRFDHSTHNTRLYLSRWSERVPPDDFVYYAEDGLLTIGYRDLPPHQIDISPQLAIEEGKGEWPQPEHLLNARAQQVWELFKDSIQLGARAFEAESFLTSRLLPGEGNAEGARAGEDGPREPGILLRGEEHHFPGRPGRDSVSIIFPVSEEDDLTGGLLERLRKQSYGERVELIAYGARWGEKAVEALRASQATLVAVDPSVSVGLAGNVAARLARGRYLVFLGRSVFPVDDRWLGSLVAPLAEDATAAAVCSRLIPDTESDPLFRRDMESAPSFSEAPLAAGPGSSTPPGPSVGLDNNGASFFHIRSTAVRAETLRKIPFREVKNAGGDREWADTVLKEGLRLRLEPGSAAACSMPSSLTGLFTESLGNGGAGSQNPGGSSEGKGIEEAVLDRVRADWRYLKEECRLQDEDLDHWRFVSMLRRLIQEFGGRVGVSRSWLPGDLEQIRLLGRRMKMDEEG